MKNILRWISTVSMILLLNACGGGGGGSTVSDNPTTTISGADFEGQSIVKELPNGESYTISDIQEVLDIPTVAGAKVYTTKIDGTYDGFFVVNGDSVEGTFTKGGTTYSVGTFKDGQVISEIISHEIDHPIAPSLDEAMTIDNENGSKKRALSKPNATILFVYNEKFWEWCNKDSTIVNNKLSAMMAYVNTAFSRSAINATVSIAGNAKVVLETENGSKADTLYEVQKRLENQSDEIYQLREQYKADIVYTLKYTKQAEGGIAFYSILEDSTSNKIYKYPNRATGSEDIYNYLDYSLSSHELGHIFGCAHDDETRLKQDGTLEKSYNKYANGYWLKNLYFDNSYFTTLMGYGNPIQNYSNPNVKYEGVSTGIAGDGIEAADCARFINFSAPYVAEYRKDTIESTNQPPVVNVESNKNADETTTVTLNATASDNDGSIAKHEWKQTGGTTVVIDNANGLNASFVAPSVDSDTQLTFELTVTDDKGAVASGSVVVTIENTTVPNQYPIANAGIDATVNEGDTTILDGSSSYDSDGIIASAKWEQISGKIVQLKSMDSSLRQYFTSPQVDGDSVLEFKLVVTDSEGATSQDTVVVTVKNIYDEGDTLTYMSSAPWAGDYLPIVNIDLPTSTFSPGSSMGSSSISVLKNIGRNSLIIYGVEYHGSNEINMHGVEECNNISLDINETTYKCSPSFSYTPTLVGLHTGNVVFKYNDGMDKNITIPITLNIIAEALKVNSLDEGFILNLPPNNGMAGSQFLDYYSYMFESNTSDMSLHLTGYDVDVENEICVYLNNIKLECLPTTPNNEYGQPLEIDIPYSMQRDGNNSIEIRQLKTGDLWGIRDIGIFKGSNSNKDEEAPVIESVTPAGCQEDEANNRFILNFDYTISDNLSSLEEISFIEYISSVDSEERFDITPVETSFAECIKSNECTKINDNTIRIQNIWGFEEGSDWEKYYTANITLFTDPSGNQVKVLFGTGEYQTASREIQEIDEIRLPEILQKCTRTIPPNRTDLNFSVTPKGVLYTSDTTEATIQFDITNNNYLGLVSYESKTGDNTSSGSIPLRSVGTCPGTYPGVNICGGFLNASLYSDTTSWNISNSTGVDVSEHFEVRFCNQDNECTQWYSYDINLK